MTNTVLDETHIGDFDPEYLAYIHARPSGDDVIFNEVISTLTADQIDTFGKAYRLPIGVVLTYKGLAATRQAAKPIIPAEPIGQTSILDVTTTGTLVLAEIQADMQARQAARGKPRPRTHKPRTPKAAS